jgi:uncharacterized cysteine cluster protein YcgN (CxxCxxCC family)
MVPHLVKYIVFNIVKYGKPHYFQDLKRSTFLDKLICSQMSKNRSMVMNLYHCSRCGRCCIYIVNEVTGERKRCKYLIGEIGKITSCRIYRNRYKQEIEKGIRCFPREEQAKLLPIPECTLIRNESS